MKKTKINECYTCEYKSPIIGDTHIMCINPDLNMKGNAYGIKAGWFKYPINFDPVWKEKNCVNYKEEKYYE